MNCRRVTSRAAAVGLFVTAIVAVLIALFWKVPVSFKVVATTETVEVEVENPRGMSWHLSDIELMSANDDHFRPFTGYYRLASHITLYIERISNGPAYIEARSQSEDRIVGELWNETYELERSVQDYLILRVLDVQERAEAGRSIVLPVTGKVSLGREARLSMGETNPVLLGGTITILGRNIVGGSVFDAASYALDTGDRFVVYGPDKGVKAESFGILIFDERPAFQTVLHALGHSGIVTRFGTTGYEITLTFWQRLRNDPMVQALWAIAVFLLGLIVARRKLMKAKTEKGR